MLAETELTREPSRIPALYMVLCCSSTGDISILSNVFFEDKVMMVVFVLMVVAVVYGEGSVTID